MSLIRKRWQWCSVMGLGQSQGNSGVAHPFPRGRGEMGVRLSFSCLLNGIRIDGYSVCRPIALSSLGAVCFLFPFVLFYLNEQKKKENSANILRSLAQTSFSEWLCLYGNSEMILPRENSILIKFSGFHVLVTSHAVGFMVNVFSLLFSNHVSWFLFLLS